jgi:hypothetical protein
MGHRSAREQDVRLRARRPGGPRREGEERPVRPEKTPLHKVIPENLASWLAWREAAERPVPSYAEDELRGNLECGLLCFGFARAVCMTCRTGFVVVFSCKGRGVCPSCNGRQGDHVWPRRTTPRSSPACSTPSRGPTRRTTGMAGRAGGPCRNHGPARRALCRQESLARSAASDRGTAGRDDRGSHRHAGHPSICGPGRNDLRAASRLRRMELAAAGGLRQGRGDRATRMHDHGRGGRHRQVSTPHRCGVSRTSLGTSSTIAVSALWR